MKRALTHLGFALAAVTALAAGTATITEDAASGQARQVLRANGIAEAELQLVFREPATWSDSSLGCRTHGALYTEAQVSGQVLRFSGASGSYEVHVAGQRAVLCPLVALTARHSLRSPVPMRTLEAMRERASADLAARLGIAVTDVSGRDMAPATWADATLGCAAGTTTAGGPVQGYRFFLLARGREYVYHTDFHQVMACPPIEAQ